MAQLAGMAGTDTEHTDQDVLALLNADPGPDPLANVDYTDDLPTDAAPS